jgi:hypothetical protein
MKRDASQTHESQVRVALTIQEREFALACRDFWFSQDPSAATEMTIEQDELVVPETPSSREAFLEHGLARLLYVCHLAIENKAVPPGRVTDLISALASFNEKIMAAFAEKPAGRLH